MARSVSYPSDSLIVCFQEIEEEEKENYYDTIEDTQERCLEKFPSLTYVSKWIGREDLAILENTLCYIGLSQYGSLMTIWVVPRSDLEPSQLNLAVGWCDRIRGKFEAMFGQLRKIGTASNGESFFELCKPDAKQPWRD